MKVGLASSYLRKLILYLRSCLDLVFFLRILLLNGLMQTSNSTVLCSALAPFNHPFKGCKYCLKVFIRQNSALCDFDIFGVSLES